MPASAVRTAGWVVAVAACWSAAVSARNGPVALFDEGIAVVNPQLLLEGLVPGHDFESAYPPGPMLLLAGPFAVLGPSVRLERAIAIGLALAAVVAFASIGRRHRVGAVVALVAVPLAFAPPVHLKAWSCAVVAWVAALAVLAGTGRTGRREVVAGVLLGAAVSCRIDLLPAAIGTAVLAGVLPAGRSGASARRLAVGGVLGVAPILWLLVAGGPSALVRLVWAPSRFQPARDLPFPGWNDPLSWPVWLAAASGCAVGVAAWRAHHRGDARTAGVLGSSVLAAATSLPYTTGRWDIVHATASLGFVGPLVPVAATMLTVRAREVVGTAAGWALVLAMLVATPDLRAVTGRRPESSWVTIAGRAAPLAPTDAEPLAAVVDLVATVAPPGSRLFVGPHDLRRTPVNDVFLYHLLPAYPPASYYTELNPGVADRPGSRLARDLEAADVLVLNRWLDAWDEPNASDDVGPDEPNEVVRRSFCAAGEVDRWIVYTRC